MLKTEYKNEGRVYKVKTVGTLHLPNWIDIYHAIILISLAGLG
jgi:hypothetical protein